MKVFFLHHAATAIVIAFAVAVIIAVVVVVGVDAVAVVIVVVVVDVVVVCSRSFPIIWPQLISSATAAVQSFKQLFQQLLLLPFC